MLANDSRCPFCSEFNNGGEISCHESAFESISGITKRCIFETENFVCAPSIGSFVEGYLLIIPKKHFLSFLAIPESYMTELLSIIHAISIFYKCIYCKELIIYEHGSVNTQNIGGMSVAHAHLHCVPCSERIITKCPEFEFLKFQSFFEVVDYYSSHQDLPYLLLKDIDDNFYFSISDEIPSQYFRKQVCNVCGVPGTWDWKQYPYVSYAKSTIENAKTFNFKKFIE